jgi:hypothetical protein
MTDRPQQPREDNHRLGIGRVPEAISRWVEPDDNPSGVVYGTIA